MPYIIYAYVEEVLSTLQFKKKNFGILLWNFTPYDGISIHFRTVLFHWWLCTNFMHSIVTIGGPITICLCRERRIGADWRPDQSSSPLPPPPNPPPPFGSGGGGRVFPPFMSPWDYYFVFCCGLPPRNQCGPLTRWPSAITASQRGGTTEYTE
jgi:hypothetical protein